MGAVLARRGRGCSDRAHTNSCRLRHSMTRVAAGLFAAWLVLPSAAEAQRGVFVDPNSPAGTEYAIPLEEARRQGVGDDERGRRDGRDPSGDPPLFGEGITRVTRAALPEAGITGDGVESADGNATGGPSAREDQDGPASRVGDARTSEAADTRQSGAGSVAVEAAAASGDSEGLVTAAIAALVLAGGLVLGFGLRRLLRRQ